MGKIKQELKKYPIRTIEQLESKFKLLWSRFSSDDCKLIVDTMPEKIKVVLKAKGDVTQY